MEQMEKEAIMDGVVLTKADLLREWVEKALYYSKKEKFTKVCPKPGEIYSVDLGINVGSEINKVRPCIIVTRTNYNMKSGVVTLVPISNKDSANKDQMEINENFLMEGNVKGVAKVEMITTVSKGRIGSYIGRLNQKGRSTLGKRLRSFLEPLSDNSLRSIH